MGRYSELVERLRKYDEYIRPCPINNPKNGRSYAPMDKCERCGARADQNCGLEATASYHFIKAVRATLAKLEAGQ